MNNPLLILDTSVIIAHLVSRRNSYTRDVITEASKGHIVFAVSYQTYEELRNTITLKNIKKLPEYNERRVGQFMVWYKYNAKLIFAKKTDFEKESRDPNDNMFLTLAATSKADYLISFDKDLLELMSVEGTKIVTPREFMNVFKTSKA